MVCHTTCPVQKIVQIKSNCCAPTLRTQTLTPPFTTPENREMRVVDKYVTVDMINNLFVCHTQLECANPFFEILSEWE